MAENYASVLAALIEQGQPATADQQARIQNVDKALTVLRKVSDSGDLIPRAKEAVDELVAALDGLGEARPAPADEPAAPAEPAATKPEADKPEADAKPAKKTTAARKH